MQSVDWLPRRACVWQPPYRGGSAVAAGMAHGVSATGLTWHAAVDNHACSQFLISPLLLA